MPEVKEYTVYTFEELSDRAKETARDWYRQYVFSDNNDWDSVYEMAATAAEMIGIDLRQKRVQLMGGGHRYDPEIYFSGFSSQGDGACFVGTYRYAPKAAAKLAKEFGTESPWAKECIRIAEALQRLQKRHFYQLVASMSHSGHYSHSGCMSVDVEDNRDSWRDIGDAEGEVRTLMRDFADAIYAALEEEYEYQNSDEVVDDNIRANEYTFDEDGNRED